MSIPDKFRWFTKIPKSHRQVCANYEYAVESSVCRKRVEDLRERFRKRKQTEEFSLQWHITRPLIKFSHALAILIPEFPRPWEGLSEQEQNRIVDLLAPIGTRFEAWSAEGLDRYFDPKLRSVEERTRMEKGLPPIPESMVALLVTQPSIPKDFFIMRIDWREGNDFIVKEFESWIRKQRKVVGIPPSVKRTGGHGTVKQWHDLLTDLDWYRRILSEASEKLPKHAYTRSKRAVLQLRIMEEFFHFNGLPLDHSLG